MRYSCKSKEFIHRKVAGNDVIISVGSNIAKLNGYIQLNEVAAFIWDELKEEKSVLELAQAVEGEFEIDAETALHDVTEFIDSLVKNEMVNIHE